MCLFSVRRDEDYEPVRITERRTRVHHHRDRVPSERISRVSVHSSTSKIPAPTGLKIPPPQPVPVFVKPPTPPAAAPDAHFVTVSPRSSEDSYYRREVTVERDYSPARSHSHRRRSRSRSRARDDRYESYRYVEPPRRSRSRHRSRSRYGDDDDYDIEYRRERRYYD